MSIAYYVITYTNGEYELQSRGGGMGYSVWKRVLTVDRVLRSCGCREQTMLKKGGCPVIINDYWELSNMFILGFYIKLQLYAFKVVQETLQNKLFCKIKSNKH